MEFSENLKRIRKENNLSQEQFAEKLGVSRQAVSKWESGQSYPEMDKVIQICKLYNFNIDELLNQNVKQINEEVEAKKNINKYIEGILSYISKTVNMFCAMKFRQKVKCIFEQCIICVCLLVIFAIIGVILASLFGSIISLFPRKVASTLEIICEALYVLFAFATSITVVLYLFKIRYLDYYKVIDRNSDEKSINTQEDNSLLDEKKIQTLELPKSDKIIFRDNDSQFKFITLIMKAILFCVKIAVCFAALGFVFTFVGIVAMSVLSFLIRKTGLLFIGILICLISSGVINYVILELCYNFIANRKANRTRIAIMLIIPLITLGLGVGTGVFGVLDFEVVEIKNEYVSQKELEVDMSNYLYILDCYAKDEIEFIEDDRDNVKIVAQYPSDLDVELVLHSYEEESYVYVECSSNTSFLDEVKEAINDINNKVIKKKEDSCKILVYASKENIKVLENNN